ncbi:hypothetical protein [uncultured Psychroserpens sp.]|uniref:hypothetical protein n=1 Tax=uncultured Psychroserpens sp. TaxID=255436 RepID=UPI0026206F3F|nr:hypothetical protein [uncultured Psychroserpens sp.]
MSMPNNILIVEQEPLIAYCIENALNHVFKSSFRTRLATSYDQAHSVIATLNKVNLVFLNMDLSSTHEKFQVINKIINALKNKSPNVKFLVMTSFKDNYKTISIVKTFNPESILLKSDIAFADLTCAIESVISGEPFYSKTILRLFRSRMTSDITLDRTDHQILHYLSKGIRTKDLPELVFLSNSGVERRKRNLKIIFDVEQKNDRFLIEQARLKGFV